MEFLGIDINVKNIPELDPGFIPLYKFNTAFLEGAKKPLGVAVERAGGEIAVQETFIHGTPRAGYTYIYYAAAAGEEHALALRRLEGVHLRRPRRL